MLKVVKYLKSEHHLRATDGVHPHRWLTMQQDFHTLITAKHHTLGYLTEWQLVLPEGGGTTCRSKSRWECLKGSSMKEQSLMWN